MHHASHLYIFESSAARDAFWADPATAPYRDLAPTAALVAEDTSSLSALLCDKTHAFYCKTICAIGKGFSANNLQNLLDNAALPWDQPATATEASDFFHYIRLPHSTHLLSAAAPNPSLLTTLQQYYALTDGASLEASARRLGHLLTHSSRTIASAESCTGGLIAKTLTDIAGASTYVCGGACTYTAAAKTHILGVPAATIQQHGIVSAETACAMASGARDLYNSTLALATTGVAGPGPDSDANPEGLVYIALATTDLCAAYKYSAYAHTILLDRDVIRKGSTLQALQLAIKHLCSE